MSISASQFYQDELDAGRFLIQHCQACQQHVFYPREICPHCGSQDLQWKEPSGQGTVYAVTTVRRKADAGGDFNVSLIDLDEGVRLMSRIEGVDPQQATIGSRVSAKVIRHNDKGLVVFTPLHKSQS